MLVLVALSFHTLSKAGGVVNKPFYKNAELD
jgi:hypothetical protein